MLAHIQTFVLARMDLWVPASKFCLLAICAMLRWAAKCMNMKMWILTFSLHDQPIEWTTSLCATISNITRQRNAPSWRFRPIWIANYLISYRLFKNISPILIIYLDIHKLNDSLFILCLWLISKIAFAISYVFQTKFVGKSGVKHSVFKRKISSWMTVLIHGGSLCFSIIKRFLFSFKIPWGVAFYDRECDV